MRARGEAAAPLAALGLGALFLGERVLRASSVSWGGGARVALGLGLALVAARRGAGERAAVERVRARALGLLAAGAGLYALGTEAGLDLLRLAPGHALERILAVAWPALLGAGALTLFFAERAARQLAPVVGDVGAAAARRVSDAATRGLALSLALVFVVAVNVAAEAKNARVDLSYLRVTEPGDVSRRLVRALGAEVTAWLVFPEGNEVHARVAPFFEALREEAPARFRARRVDHALAPELVTRHRVTGNGWLVLVRGEGETEQAELVELGTELAEARPKLRTLDGRFQEAFARLTQPRREAYLTAGHRERGLGGEEEAAGERLGRFTRALRGSNIGVRRLGMADGLAQGVPADVPLVAVMGPRAPFAPEEQRALLDYVRGGGRLLVLVDHEAEGGLDLLLGGLGLRLEPGALASEESAVPRTRTEADRARIFANRFGDHPVVLAARRRSSGAAVVVERGAGLAPTEAGAEGVRWVFPARTEEEVWRDVDGDLEHDEGEARGMARVVAVTSVRAPRSERDGRVVVIGDGSFAGDDLFTYRGNFLVLGEALRWLLEGFDDGAPAIVGVTTSEEDAPIVHSPEGERLWFWATSLGMPLPLLLVALWIGRPRRRRREERRGGAAEASADSGSEADSEAGFEAESGSGSEADSGSDSEADSDPGFEADASSGSGQGQGHGHGQGSSGGAK